MDHTVSKEMIFKYYFSSFSVWLVPWQMPNNAICTNFMCLAKDYSRNIYVKDSSKSAVTEINANFQFSRID